MLDEYLFSSLVCINTLIREPENATECGLIILLTRNLFLYDEQPPKIEQLTATFTNLAKELQNDYKTKNIGSKTEGPVDTTNYVIEYIYPHISKLYGVSFNVYELVTESKRDSGWQNVEAPWTWYWIHLTTMNMDLSCGLDEKVYFIRFIAKLIGCTICRSHYDANKQVLIKGLTQYSLTDLYLQLHTHTKSNGIDLYTGGGSSFILSNKLVQRQYKREYERKFLQTFRAAQK